MTLCHWPLLKIGALNKADTHPANHKVTWHINNVKVSHLILAVLFVNYLRNGVFIDPFNSLLEKSTLNVN